MLSLTQFTELPRDQKQAVLVGVFSQLRDDAHPTRSDDIAFMLDAHNAYSDTTLISLYEHVLAILAMKNEEDQTDIQQQMDVIRTKLANEAKESEHEADSILTNL